MVETPEGRWSRSDDSVSDGTQLTLVTAGSDASGAQEGRYRSQALPIVGICRSSTTRMALWARWPIFTPLWRLLRLHGAGGKAYFCADADIVSR